MAIAHVVSITAAPNSNGGTTSNIDTTGANFILINVSWYYPGATTPTVSDSKGNTWTSLTLRTDTTTRANRLYYAKNATVGTGHNFTVFASGALFYPAIIVHAFSGVHVTSPFDVENGTATTSGNSVSPGSITPTQNGALVVAGFGGENVGSIAVGSSLTQTTRNYFSGNNMAGATGYIIQTTAAAINPTWTWTGTVGGAVSIASFLPSVAAASSESSFVFLQ